ncbi:MAG: glycosyltransferase [Patescibacteria group bacterium]
MIPTKNEASSLPTLLNSIKRQSLQPAQIIIADASSTDGTADIAREEGCEVVEGGLPAVGRNRGADAVHTQFLLFLDADVILDDDRFLEKAIAEMQKRDLDVATCNVKPLSKRWIDLFFHNLYNRYMRLVVKWHPVAPGFCIFTTREMHQKIGGFDETITFCEDHDYVIRASSKGRFAILQTVQVAVSVRRFDRDGRHTIAIKYLLAEIYMLIIGPIRTNIFNYTFGHK